MMQLQSKSFCSKKLKKNAFSHLLLRGLFGKLTVYFSSQRGEIVRFNVIKRVWDKLAQVSENPLIFDKSK
jgi:hypothetical protein